MPKHHPEGKYPPFEKHIPVLISEVDKILQPKTGESYLDLTAGYGGHAEAVMAKTKNPAGAILVDRDSEAIKALKVRFGKQPVQLVQKDFLTASRELVGHKKFDLILADLGISSQHLDEAERGFSFKRPAPLDMRMDKSQKLSASDIVNGWPEDKLAKILKLFGQEPKASIIAKRIVGSRPIQSTDELAAIAGGVWRGRSKIHPATRTFQAIRIAVNNELSQLEQSLPLWEKLLRPGGRLAVISFHSLEDRLVKRFFLEHSGGYDSGLILLTKKPITASRQELVSNPRARSAKLRAAAKIKTIER